MPKMKVIQADGSFSIVEDETFKKKQTLSVGKPPMPRQKLLDTIVNALQTQSGQTIEQLVESTKIPVHYTRTYLLDLEKDKKIVRSNSRYYLVHNS